MKNSYIDQTNVNSHLYQVSMSNFLWFIFFNCWPLIIFYFSQIKGQFSIICLMRKRNISYKHMESTLIIRNSYKYSLL